MIKSMTAFARQPIEKDWGTGAWEIRSVNSRYLETNFRLPEVFRSLEFKLREKLRKKLSRGKIDCSLRLDFSQGNNEGLSVDYEFAESLIKAHKSLQSIAKIEQAPDLTRLLNFTGMIKKPEVDSDLMEKELLSSLDDAIEQLIKMRAREGESITVMIQQRLDGIAEQISYVQEEMPVIAKWQKEKILSRFEEVKLELDENRFEQEMVMVAQKIDVDEELDRLDAHIKEVTRLIKKGGVVGRRLDFLMQELNREANTLGSKSISQKTTGASIELKVLIEQMREQIQNVE
ncbi:MAG: YicC family protein [Kangiella sp.]|nr:MAG: YicC family protein [Kangiella sp.]